MSAPAGGFVTLRIELEADERRPAERIAAAMIEHLEGASIEVDGMQHVVEHCEMQAAGSNG